MLIPSWVIIAISSIKPSGLGDPFYSVFRGKSLSGTPNGSTLLNNPISFRPSIRYGSALQTINGLYNSQLLTSVNELMHGSVATLDSQWMLWVGLFLFSVSLFLNYYLCTLLKYNKSLSSLLSVHQTSIKAQDKSKIMSPGKSQEFFPKKKPTIDQEKEMAVMPPFLGEIKDLEDEQILRLLDEGRFQPYHLEKLLDNFERAILLRRLHAGKYGKKSPIK